MVFIEHKYQYIEDLKANTTLAPIIDFLFFDTVLTIDNANLNNSHYVTTQLILSIKTLNEGMFLNCYNAYRKKLPDERSPWIYNNYLLFFFLVASLKFQKDLDWIKISILKRKKGADNEEDLMSDFFYNAVNGNFQPEGKYSPFNLCFRYLLDSKSLRNEDIKGCLKEINSRVNFPFYRSELLNILCLKSFDICLEVKDIKNLDLEDRYKRFESKFLKRVDITTNILVYIFLAVLIIASYRIMINMQEQKRNVIIILLGIAGVTVLEVLKLRNTLTKGFKKILYKYFGYTTL